MLVLKNFKSFRATIKWIDNVFVCRCRCCRWRCNVDGWGCSRDWSERSEKEWRRNAQTEKLARNRDGEASSGKWNTETSQPTFLFVEKIVSKDWKRGSRVTLSRARSPSSALSTLRALMSPCWAGSWSIPNAFTLVWSYFLHWAISELSDICLSVQPNFVHYYEETKCPGWEVQEASEETHQNWRKPVWKVSLGKSLKVLSRFSFLVLPRVYYLQICWRHLFSKAKYAIKTIINLYKKSVFQTTPFNQYNATARWPIIYVLCFIPHWSWVNDWQCN